MKSPEDGILKFDESIIHCPICGGEFQRDDLSTLVCLQCSRKYPVSGGIPLLNPSQSVQTKLRSDEYNRAHGITEAKRQEHYVVWEKILGLLQGGKQRLLEIGCGTGLLSYGLAEHSQFDSLHFSDVSLEMVRYTEGVLPDRKKKCFFYVLDANSPPFKEETFDCAVGNSVLHHLLYYERTLEKLFKILCPGGMAVFLEPYLVSKAYAALIIKMMLLVDKASEKSVLSENDILAIERLVRHATTIPMLKNDKKKLAQIEDKYIFSYSDMKSVSIKAGFESLEIYPSLPSGASRIHGFRNYVIPWLLSAGFSKDKLEPFDQVFKTFEETVEYMLKDELLTPMVFFVFRKTG